MGTSAMSSEYSRRLQGICVFDSAKLRQPRTRNLARLGSMPGVSWGVKMTEHSFSIIASGLDHEAEDFEDRFFEAGCDDATISVQKGALILEFDREAPTFAQAVKSAIADVERAGATTVHVEPTHLVSLSDIANRAGLSRAAISQYANGSRGESFPPPVVRVTTENPLWDWVRVARWLCARGQLPRAEQRRATIVRAFNRRFG